MRPSSEEILKGIKYTLKEVVVPDLRSPWPQWMAEQIGYFIDHLIIRYQEEPQMLMDENRELREILSEAGRVFRAVSLDRNDVSFMRLADEINGQLKAQHQKEIGYISVPFMQEENNILKTKVCESIEAIEKAEEEMPSLNEVRVKIRGYIKRQVKREALFMHSLFAVKRDSQSS